MAVSIAHLVSFEMFDMVQRPRRHLSMARVWASIAVLWMKMIVHVAYKLLGTVKPGTSANKDAVVEPFRAIVAVRSAVVGRDVVITIRGFVVIGVLSQRTETQRHKNQELPITVYKSAGRDILRLILSADLNRDPAVTETPRLSALGLLNTPTP
jgi:hypothetical protein